MTYENGKRYIVTSTRTGQKYSGIWSEEDQHFTVDDGCCLPAAVACDVVAYEYVDPIDTLLDEVRAWRAWWDDPSTKKEPYWHEFAPCRRVLEARQTTDRVDFAQGWGRTQEPSNDLKDCVSTLNLVRRWGDYEGEYQQDAKTSLHCRKLEGAGFIRRTENRWSWVITDEGRNWLEQQGGPHE